MIASMPDYSLTLPSWSVGENALDKIREILPSGQIAVVIGGKKGTAVPVWNRQRRVMLRSTVFFGTAAKRQKKTLRRWQSRKRCGTRM